MRHRSIISAQQASARVNVTPMIDVVMVLIVFYLLVGQLAMDRRAAIALPQTGAGVTESDTTDPIVIGVARDGACTLNGVSTDPQRLPDQLTGLLAETPGAPLRVRADRAAAYASVRPVIDALRQIGAGKVELVTEQRP